MSDTTGPEACTTPCVHKRQSGILWRFETKFRSCQRFVAGPSPDPSHAIRADPLRQPGGPVGNFFEGHLVSGCPNCGASQKARHRFCWNCGARLDVRHELKQVTVLLADLCGSTE
ncbi:MAG: hypothetical protein ABUU24_02395, partial [Variovorax sp.]